MLKMAVAFSGCENKCLGLQLPEKRVVHALLKSYSRQCDLVQTCMQKTHHILLLIFHKFF